MAEDEVVKHTVKAVKLFRDKEKTWWQRTKEIILEIAIIVFAITFSLWMHNRSEDSHNQQNVKQFLLGIKGDLQSDLKEMAEDTSFISLRLHGANYLIGIYVGKEVYNQDTVGEHITNILFGSTLLIPNNGRYEGFKSSGQLGYIENKKLANLIVDHYQEVMVSLLWVSQIQNDFFKDLFMPYAVNHFEITKQLKLASIEKEIQQSQFHSLLIYYILNEGAVLNRYRKVIQSSKDIIAAIDNEHL
jgi:hypothetical protein